MPSLSALAQELGVSPGSLESLGVRWSDDAWLIPERDEQGAVIGYSKRFADGSKGFVKGGKRGLTYRVPFDFHAGAMMSDPVYIVEGASDAAAGLSIDVEAVGRPSNTGGALLLADMMRGRHIVIIAENDGPGQRGAESVAGQIHDCTQTLRVISPPKEHKDLRQWVSAGCDRLELAGVAAEAPEYEPQHVGRGLMLRRGRTVNDEGMRYLWRRRIPLGGPTIIFSRPGAGKSTLAADLTSNVTRGQPWPDGAPCEQGSVIYIKGEGTDASIRDRMKGAGADPDRYYILGRARVDEGSDETPMLDLGGDDANLLSHEVRKIGDVRMIVVDTMDSLYPSMRMIDNAHIRKSLWPMQELAAEHDLALVVLAHTNKGGYTDPLDRLSGGRAIGGSARAVWYLGQRDREDVTHFMSAVKVNDFRPEPSIEYQIVGDSPDKPGAIRWGSVVDDVSAWDLDLPPKGESTGKADACVDWIRDRLSGGPEPVGTFKSGAEDAGFGRRALTAAKRVAEVEIRAMPGSRPPSYWACLPGQEPPHKADAN